MNDLSVILLHADMIDKESKVVTTSLTLIDIHDIARSSATFGAKTAFIAHPSPTLRKLAHTIESHWEDGYGATYNPDRKKAIECIDIISDLDEAIHKIDLRTGKIPKLIATSAHEGESRISYSAMRELINMGNEPYLLMFGTGWGMSDALLSRADYLLEPIRGFKDYNHLSVRSACAIVLDRLLGQRE
ncbi:MAG: RNA methyltransferase [SAR324 cluster bacterium]|uniref:RNA methyltransferase n=1 Tax=SAR324 cluster bacterium TaxID=2024889 RepID=A0A7X9IJV1_9DELT|nr:RNA methyltransferase [SAR324 cluster bacterium]